MKNNEELLVYADWFHEPKIIGTLYCIFGNGKEVYSFEYSKEWLSEFSHIILDPDLYNTLGRQYASNNKTFFGFLSDCLPDRWGRKLLKRKEAILAEEESRVERQLNNYDYLLGINDESRMGALRFKKKINGSFISANDNYNVPPFENLRKLEQASLDFEKAEFMDDKALKILLDPGSSLGGARPKATVKDADGVLWIAKFPSHRDDSGVNTTPENERVKALSEACLDRSY
ncbi:MAG: HipA N-terminal domain-containing protein [Treponema sp.]|nr:HipA N-terminal domain-containing protein [Treponema sp.]